MWYSPMVSYTQLTPIDDGSVNGVYLIDDKQGYVTWFTARATEVVKVDHPDFQNMIDHEISHWWSEVNGVNVGNTEVGPNVVAVEKGINYWTYVHCAHWSGDQMTGDWEFLDAQGNVLAALHHQKNSTFSLRATYGPNLSSLTSAPHNSGNYGFIYGYFSFEDNGIYFRERSFGNNPYGYYTQSDYLVSPNGGCTHIRYTNMYAYTTYANSGNAPCTMLRCDYKSQMFTTRTNFTASLSNYNAYNSGIFVQSGTTLTINHAESPSYLTQTGTEAGKAVYATFEFMVGSDSTGEAAYVSIEGLGAFRPRRASTTDALQRMQIDSTYFGSKPAANQWYRVVMDRIDSGTVVVSVYEGSDPESFVLFGKDVVHTGSEVTSPTTPIQFANGGGTVDAGQTFFRNLIVHYGYDENPNP